jgi:hypothetical protein
MKQTTKEWLSAAEDDLLAAQKLAGEKRILMPVILETWDFCLMGNLH